MQQNKQASVRVHQRGKEYTSAWKLWEELSTDCHTTTEIIPAPAFRFETLHHFSPLGSFPCCFLNKKRARRVGHPKIEERPGKIGSHARAVSHASVTCVLAVIRLGAVSVELRGVIVSLRLPHKPVDSG